MAEHDGFCETCGNRATWVMAETGPPARLAFFCEEHVALASLAPMAAVEDAIYACTDARDAVLTAVWQSVSDRYPDPVRLDDDLRTRAGMPAAGSWDVLRRLPMSPNTIGITHRIKDWPPSPPGDEGD
jgi:hypothetical protein